MLIATHTERRILCIAIADISTNQLGSNAPEARASSNDTRCQSQEFIVTIVNKGSLMSCTQFGLQQHLPMVLPDGTAHRNWQKKTCTTHATKVYFPKKNYERFIGSPKQYTNQCSEPPEAWILNERDGKRWNRRSSGAIRSKDHS